MNTHSLIPIFKSEKVNSIKKQKIKHENAMLGRELSFRN